MAGFPGAQLAYFLGALDTVGIMALVAQQEREAISRRTREALAAIDKASAAGG